MGADPLCGSSLAVKDVSLRLTINPVAVEMVLRMQGRSRAEERCTGLWTDAWNHAEDAHG